MGRGGGVGAAAEGRFRLGCGGTILARQRILESTDPRSAAVTAGAIVVDASEVGGGKQMSYIEGPL